MVNTYNTTREEVRKAMKAFNKASIPSQNPAGGQDSSRIPPGTKGSSDTTAQVVALTDLLVACRAPLAPKIEPVDQTPSEPKKQNASSLEGPTTTDKEGNRRQELKPQNGTQASS